MQLALLSIRIAVCVCGYGGQRGRGFCAGSVDFSRRRFVWLAHMRRANCILFFRFYMGEARVNFSRDEGARAKLARLNFMCARGRVFLCVKYKVMRIE